MDIDSFYKKNWSKMVKFVCNAKRGGDGKQVSYDEAVDIIHTAFEYFIAKPDKWNSTWVWHKLMQLRSNYIRDESRRTAVHYQHLQFEPDDEEYDVEDTVLVYDLASKIKQEIEAVENHTLRKLYTAYFIDNKPYFSNSSRDRMRILRFKQKMIDKYGGEG